MTHECPPNPSPTSWTTRLIDAGDGSGDAILVFPPDLVDQWGLKEGDVVTITNGESGELLIRRKDQGSDHEKIKP